MDRVRLKDRIIDNISRAIKTIQEDCRGSGGYVLTIDDRECQRLCENVDHALLHGLRHITNGYWRVVKEFTHKSLVKEIGQMRQVTTNLGRGRAWLYMALNEGLLESYMKCFLETPQHVRKYYVKEAFILDVQRLSLLVSLTADLENATFKMECDVPYLDLSTSPPKPRSTSRGSSINTDDDHLSLHSMDSSSSLLSPLPKIPSVPESLKTMTDSDYFSGDVIGYHGNSTATSPRSGKQTTGSGKLIVNGDGLIERRSSFSADNGSRMTRLTEIMGDVDENGENDLEVVRQKPKLKRKKKGVKSHERSKNTERRPHAQSVSSDASCDTYEGVDLIMDGMGKLDVVKKSDQSVGRTVSCDEVELSVGNSTDLSEKISQLPNPSNLTNEISTDELSVKNNTDVTFQERNFIPNNSTVLPNAVIIVEDDINDQSTVNGTQDVPTNDGGRSSSISSGVTQIRQISSDSSDLPNEQYLAGKCSNVLEMALSRKFSGSLPMVYVDNSDLSSTSTDLNESNDLIKTDAIEKLETAKKDIQEFVNGIQIIESDGIQTVGLLYDCAVYKSDDSDIINEFVNKNVITNDSVIDFNLDKENIYASTPHGFQENVPQSILQNDNVDILSNDSTPKHVSCGSLVESCSNENTPIHVSCGSLVGSSSNENTPIHVSYDSGLSENMPIHVSYDSGLSDLTKTETYDDLLVAQESSEKILKNLSSNSSLVGLSMVNIAQHHSYNSFEDKSTGSIPNDNSSTNLNLNSDAAPKHTDNLPTILPNDSIMTNNSVNIQPKIPTSNTDLETGNISVKIDPLNSTETNHSIRTKLSDTRCSTDSIKSQTSNSTSHSISIPNSDLNTIVLNDSAVTNGSFLKTQNNSVAANDSVTSPMTPDDSIVTNDAKLHNDPNIPTKTTDSIPNESSNTKNESENKNTLLYSDSAIEAEQFFDIYTSSNTPYVDKATTSESTSSDGSDSLHTNESVTASTKVKSSKSVARGKGPAKVDYQIKIDNNTLLYIMLEVLTHDMEQCLHMFAARSGHTDGDGVPVFVLITDHCLYVIRQNSRNSHKFAKMAVIELNHIDYVSLGVHGQIVQVVCTNRRNQYWLTTGDRELSRQITDALSQAMSNCEHLVLSPLCVLTDATAQKIALRKYIAAESQVEDIQTVLLEHYALIHWEDATSLHSDLSLHKEDHLLYKTEYNLFVSMWRTGYVVLKDGTLCIYQRSTDDKPLIFMKLHPSDCVGCRRVVNSDKRFCLEIRMYDGTWVELSARSANEAHDWLQMICRAVTQYSLDGDKERQVLPCCVLLSDSLILMIHEDLETSFVRTLGKATVTDLTAVRVSRESATFCVLEFESQDSRVTSGQWVVYFASHREMDKFVTQIAAVWASHFMVELPVGEIVNPSLLEKTSQMSQALCKELTLRQSK